MMPRIVSPSAKDKLLNNNLDLFVLGSFLAFSHGWSAAVAEEAYNHGGSAEDVPVASSAAIFEDDEPIDIPPTYAVLYPWLTQTIAIFIYYVLTRYLTFLPYAACVFLLGCALGYAPNEQPGTVVGKSSWLWMNIDGELVLLIFLPGLIFLESFTINVHLFFQAFWQIVIFAFPMVLVGTGLTTLVAKYIFPYNWPWALCATFGGILSATDPGAVSGLMNALGAPPRLKMHIGGESLLNDGSSVLFYSIFSQTYFNQLGIDGFGADIGWGEGFAILFRLTFGGAAIGVAFGLGTIFVLKLLNRRLSAEENVMQVVALISVAYLTYFIADVVSGCSGIIATIACGLTVGILGEPSVNDLPLAHHFLEVTGQLLNTLLFILGGTLWGDLISGDRIGNLNNRGYYMDGTDWLYLLVLLCMLTAIRFVSIFGFYPITSRIGIGSDIRESVFMAYGGFRGSVGIALSLALYAKLMTAIDSQSGVNTYATYERQVGQMFYLVGGVSLFTLFMMGLTSKPLLQMLKLTTQESTRQKVISNYRKKMAQQALATYVRLLSQERFKGQDFSYVKETVPFLSGITFDQLMEAVRWHKNNTPEYKYSTPRLEHVVPYLYYSPNEEEAVEANVEPVTKEHICTHRRDSSVRKKGHPNWDNVFCSLSSSKASHAGSEEDSVAVDEARLNFIEIIRSAYHRQVEDGELAANDDLHYSLLQSLNFCEDAAAKGLPLNDWEATKVASATNVVLVSHYWQLTYLRLKQMWREKTASCSFRYDIEMFEVWMLVRQSLAFVRAHRSAQQEFEEHFASTPLTFAEQQILDESKAQVLLAEADLEGIKPIDVQSIKGYFLCSILLYEAIHYVEMLSRWELLPEKEASIWLAELDGCIENNMMISSRSHIQEQRLSLATQAHRLRQLPHSVLNELNLWEAIEEMARQAESETPSDLGPQRTDDLASPLLG